MLAARRVHHLTVLLLPAGSAGCCSPAGAVPPLTALPEPRRADLLWALSGLGSGVAMSFPDRGLSRGAMSVVVPVSAVTGVALSVLYGVLVLGDRPGAVAWAGIAVTLPALWLVSGGAGTGRGPAVTDGPAAGAGVAVQYLALGQAGPGSGLWPVAAGRAAAVPLLLPAAVRHRRRPRTPPRQGAEALLTGAGAALALILCLLTAQRQLLAVAVVLAALHPAPPVLLGLAPLHEPLTPRQAAGFLGAAAATVLLALG